MKCSSKVAVEDGVDDRIQRRVAVAEPEEHGEQHRRWFRKAIPGQWRHQVDSARCGNYEIMMMMMMIILFDHKVENSDIVSGKPKRLWRQTLDNKVW